MGDWGTGGLAIIAARWAPDRRRVGARVPGGCGRGPQTALDSHVLMDVIGIGWKGTMLEVLERRTGGAWH